MTRVLRILIAGLAMGATALPGQQPEGRWVVVPTVGLMRFDRTSALSSIDEGLSTTMWLSGGLTGLYALRSDLRVGLYIEGGQAETSPDYFRYTLFRTTGAYELRAISQRVVFLDYGVIAAWDVPAIRNAGPYLKAGVGGHSVLLDVQRTNSTRQAGGTEFVLGGGLNYQLRGNVAVQLELLDFMWSDWDRDKLNTALPSEQNTVFEEDNPPGVLWDKPSLIHNLRLAVGFKFTPAIQ
ncbi:MAG: hypothetical protein HYS40_01980 [Gemmatimonadetes bacterium]|nr:hypothetical protein [Gemmatimonadota bacterium]